jgi:hypothetical protein
MAEAETRQVIAHDVDRNGREPEEQADPHAPIMMSTFPIRVRLMTNTLASWLAVLVGTALGFIHGFPASSIPSLAA